MIGFTVGVDGAILGPVVVRSSGSPLLDNEGLRVVRAMPPWMPAVNHNRRVPSYFKQPFTFRLN